MNMSFRRAACAILWVVFVPSLTFASAGFVEYKKGEFAPVRGEVFQIPLRLAEDADVKIELYTADGDLVRTLVSDKPFKKGDRSLSWDGKDSSGMVVPNDAYVPVLSGRDAKGKDFRIDPREHSGGEIVDDLQVKITTDGNIAYTLPAPARVLIRTGIKSGPMMRSLANWEPRLAGKNVQRWDGFDQSRLIDLRTQKNLSVLVTAFRLPDRAIVTVGNNDLTYANYRTQKGWPIKTVKPEEIILQRGDRRISRQYYVSPAMTLDPPIELEFPKELARSAAGLPIIRPGQSVLVKVDVDKAHRWLFDESLYEVAFFIDHAFVSEEEQGYVPITWSWTVDALSPGQHFFTVNISGFSGKVGVVSQLFEVAK